MNLIVKSVLSKINDSEMWENKTKLVVDGCVVVVSQIPVPRH